MNLDHPTEAFSTPQSRLGGHLVADALAVQGVDTIFGVPGESYLPVLDGLYRHQDIRFVICRQEGGAAFMADAYAKLSGKAAVLMVTRGPGATNASIGIHTAHQDSSPMVVLVGQVGNDMTDREAFQEIDYRRMFGPMVKWVAQVDQAHRIPEYFAHAFQLAMSGRKGPVVLALPEDVLSATASVADTGPSQAVQAYPQPDAMKSLGAALREAQRAIIIAGGSGWTHEACQQLQYFSERYAIPVACAFRFQDLFDNHHPHYVGDVGIGINPALAARIKGADLVLALGPRLGEMTTSGYTLFEVPIPRQAIAHVHPGNDELGRVYQTRWMINASMPAFMDALIKESDAISLASNDFVQRKQLIDEARAQYERWQEQPPASQQAVASGSVDPWLMVQALRAIAPADTILTNGAGNFATWAHRFWRYGPMRSQLAPTSGAMGYGIPAAVAAAICYPERSVVCFAGDGDFLMTAQEFATAIQYQAGFVVIVFNNSMYGTIRMHQERDYPARVYGTNLVNPDFARYAEAFGGWGFVVTENDQIGQALEQALAFARSEKKPAVVELRLSQQIIT
ncbi:MAG: thiamine pyrophosphate-binding protein, partial [Betaproteobacteria bacterium]|nr:thiamine pyrophosphate-binding protein [Betaproteobacteria bacterium]